MTNNEKKAFLCRYNDNEREIVRLEEEMARWESRAQKVTASYSHAPAHGNDGDRVQVAVEQIIEIKSTLYDRLTDATELRKSIQAAIATVEDARLRRILEYRFIDKRTLEDIAEEENISWRHAKRLSASAIDAVKLEDVLLCHH